MHTQTGGLRKHLSEVAGAKGAREEGRRVPQAQHKGRRGGSPLDAIHQLAMTVTLQWAMWRRLNNVYMRASRRVHLTYTHKRRLCCC